MQEAGKICKRIWEELEEDVNGKIKKFILCLGQYLAKDVFVKQDDTCLPLKGMLRIKQNNIQKLSFKVYKAPNEYDVFCINLKLLQL